MSIEPYPEGWNVLRKHWHFYAMYYVRFHRPLGYGDYSDIARQIKSGRAKRISERVSSKTEVWAVRIRRPRQGRPIRFVVWDVEKKSLVTVFRPKPKLRKALKSLT